MNELDELHFKHKSILVDMHAATRNINAQIALGMKTLMGDLEKKDGGYGQHLRLLIGHPSYSELEITKWVEYYMKEVYSVLVAYQNFKVLFERDTPDMECFVNRYNNLIEEYVKVVGERNVEIDHLKERILVLQKEYEDAT